ncbi:MAG TPA: sugar phosphate nucleotidyltransferase, partial [Patescibacteria group bacterium]|nr:sugar phosphate nucleotidyltransferase [Patescibacteria group bacterium]
MIAIIPAAGLGTRFLPFTKSVPKELVPIVGTPAIQCIIEEAIYNDISSFCIVSSDTKSALKDYLTENTVLNSYLEQKNKLFLLDPINKIIKKSTITFVNQSVPLGLGHAVLCAQDSIQNDQDYVAIMLPDELLYTNPSAPASLLKNMYILA